MKAQVNGLYIYYASRFFNRNIISHKQWRGVYIKPCSKGGVQIVATNCHALAMFYDKDGCADKAFFFEPSKEFLKALKPTKKDTFSCAFTDNNVEIQSSVSNSTFPFLPLEQKYDYETVKNIFQKIYMRENKPCAKISFPLESLNLFDFKAFGETFLTFYHSEKYSPVLVKNNLVPDFLGVIMPSLIPAEHNTEDKDNLYPNWAMTEFL